MKVIWKEHRINADFLSMVREEISMLSTKRIRHKDLEDTHL